VRGSPPPEEPRAPGGAVSPGALERLRGLGGESETALEIRRALPVVIAAAVVSVVSLLTTVVVAHVLTTDAYGTLVVLLGLFLVLSLPGSALLVGVVRRMSVWEAEGHGEQIRPWVGRVHTVGVVGVVCLAGVMWLVRVPVAHALSLSGPSGVMEILTAGGVWVLVSIDRGLLQGRQDYRHLAINLMIEATTRTLGTIVLAEALGLEGAALGLLVAEIVTAVHARIVAMRALSTPPSATTVAPPPAPSPPPVAAGTRPERVPAGTVHGRGALAADVVAALASLALLALLQNIDIIVLGSKAHTGRGAYAAISVPSKALVFGALVFLNYLLPEAAIRHHRGSHALRQLGHTLVVLALPCVTLLLFALFAPRWLLGLVFGHRLTAAAPAFATLVSAMILLSVTVLLTVYLLGVGWRWVIALLGAGAAALALLTARADGHFLGTARADLAVQGALTVAMVVAFVAVHRSGAERRAIAASGGVPG